MECAAEQKASEIKQLEAVHKIQVAEAAHASDEAWREKVSTRAKKVAAEWKERMERAEQEQRAVAAKLKEQVERAEQEQRVVAAKWKEQMERAEAKWKEQMEKAEANWREQMERAEQEQRVSVEKQDGTVLFYLFAARRPLKLNGRLCTIGGSF